MTRQKKELILITGIPGTGKTTYGELFANRFGFIHYDLENRETINGLCVDPSKYIDSILNEGGRIVATWGFLPQEQMGIVKEFQAKGFTLVWFDGNRPAALRVFNRRGTVPEYLFHMQIGRIDNSRVVQDLKPLVIDPFDDNEEFKDATLILEEIRKGSAPNENS